MFSILDNVLIAAETQTKDVKFYNIEDLQGSTKEVKPYCIYKSWKKVTQLVPMKIAAPKIEGVLLSDRTGEVRFLSIDKTRQAEVIDSKSEDEVQTAKTIFGH